MKIIHDSGKNLPPIPPSNGNGNGSKLDESIFKKPSAHMLPMQAKPAVEADKIHMPLPIPQTKMGWFYQILVNFIRDTSGGEKHG